MTSSIALASQFLSFLGFLGTCIVLFRYLDPWNEYITFVNLTVQIRSTWDRREYEGLLPKNEKSRLPFLRRLECLEREVLELAYLIKTSTFRTCLRAWTSTVHLKMLARDARHLHVALLIIVECNRRIQDTRRPGTPLDIGWMEEKIESISAEFIEKSTRNTGSRSQGGLPFRPTDADVSLVVSQPSSRPGCCRRMFEIWLRLIGGLVKRRAVAQQQQQQQQQQGSPRTLPC